MGVLNFYRKFIKDIVINSLTDQEIEIDAESVNPHSVLLDANGILYDVANEIYCLTKNYSQEQKDLVNSKLRSQEGKIELFVLFSQKLKEILTKNIIELFNPSQILIIGIDGKAFRAKQKQQRGRRFKSAKELESSQFDVGNFTVGTKFLSACCNVIEDWIIEKKEQLPPYVYFSPCCEEGEAEHKIFSIFETALTKIEEDYSQIEGYPKKTATNLMKDKNHMVIGKDSDLFFLSILRYDYNFYWFRDTNSFSSNRRNIATSVTKIRDYIAETMMNEDRNNAVQCIRDFVLMSFLIGDDFVPGNFCLDIHIGRAILEMMIIYREKNIKILKEKQLKDLEMDLQIDLDEFYRFLKSLKNVEREFFYVKKQFQSYEETEESSEKGRILEELHELKNTWFVNLNNKFERSSFLEGDYEDFLEEWKINVICPNYRNLNKKEKAFFNGLSKINEEFDDVCASFLTGLQWNISCYHGVKKLSNWVYMWSFAPTISELVDFLKAYEDFKITDHLDFSREELNHTSVLMTLFNINYSQRLINQTITDKKTEKSLTAPVDLAIIKAHILYEAFNPKNFKTFFEGKYFYDKYGETVILPMIPIQIQQNFKLVSKVEKNVENTGTILSYGRRQTFNIRSKTKNSSLFDEIFHSVTKPTEPSKNKSRGTNTSNSRTDRSVKEEPKEEFKEKNTNTYKKTLKSFS